MNNQTRIKFKSRLGVQLALAAACLFGASAVIEQPSYSASRIQTRSIKVRSVPVNFSLFNRTETRFGKLLWLGGLELIGKDEHFGGLSGIAIGLDGKKFVAVSDQGMWVSGDIQYDGSKLKSVSNIKISPILDPGGRHFEEKYKHDAESVAPYGTKGLDGKLLVAFERRQRIGRYGFGKKGFAAREITINLPAEAKKARRNKELESVGRFPKGSPLAKTIIAISERFLDKNGNIIGWLIAGRNPGRFTVKRLDDYNITDLTITPDGELIILERYFNPLIGVKMRLRKIDPATIKPGAVLDGEVLLHSDQRNTIDNMEGLASHRAANGDIILTLISDDNFNVFQRTLLLQFALEKK